MVGAEGRCYAWDTRAQGYGRGEGVAALILKPLDAAIKDGDNIHAVIRDTGLNQDGKTATITSPSMDAQVKLIEACYKRAGLDLSDTAYVEAHMTGTKVGDAAEAEALAKTFGKARVAEDPILVGSVKTNVGHTEAVSGLAGVIKTAFALKHAQIAPNTNYKETNAKIKLDEWHLQVSHYIFSRLSNRDCELREVSGSDTSDSMAARKAPKSVHQQLWLWWDQCARYSRKRSFYQISLDRKRWKSYKRGEWTLHQWVEWPFYYWHELGFLEWGQRAPPIPIRNARP